MSDSSSASLSSYPDESGKKTEQPPLWVKEVLMKPTIRRLLDTLTSSGLKKTREMVVLQPSLTLAEALRVKLTSFPIVIIIIIVLFLAPVVSPLCTKLGSLAKPKCHFWGVHPGPKR